MKKLLIVHNKYREEGGEDLSVENEIILLKKYFEIEVIYFDNYIKNYLSQFISFFINKNYKSQELLKDKISTFKPDHVYVHNTWFKASSGIFETLSEKGITPLLKLHNFRQSCTTSFLSKIHLNGEKVCKACGYSKSNSGYFNKYFSNSYLKSFLIVYYGKKYIKILKNYDLKILVLTSFHKKFLINKGIVKEKIFVYPNYVPNQKVKTRESDKNYILYAGRISEEKGLSELIESFKLANLKNLKLKIIGDGPMYKNLSNRYRSEEIEFYGRVDNAEVLQLIYNSKAVVTATKLYEGQPTLLCEAATFGVPSIFPKTGGVAEFFPEKYLLTFNQFDYDDLIEKIKLLNDSKLIEQQGLESQYFINDYIGENRLMKIFNKLLDND
jgi:glycosyltransferase involved in cell wall biosynthesis